MRDAGARQIARSRGGQTSPASAFSRWDIAAGILLITEAGGLVGDLRGGERHLETGHVVAGNPKIKAPVVKLSSIQPSYYEGFWYYGKAKPELGKEPSGGGSSPVTLDFVFEITNPNDFLIQYESSSFFLFFEDYELRVVNDSNPMWIPPGKPTQKCLT